MFLVELVLPTADYRFDVAAVSDKFGQTLLLCDEQAILQLHPEFREGRDPDSRTRTLIYPLSSFRRSRLNGGTGCMLCGNGSACRNCRTIFRHANREDDLAAGERQPDEPRRTWFMRGDWTTASVAIRPWPSARWRTFRLPTGNSR
jgi:hypothetical protein